MSLQQSKVGPKSFHRFLMSNGHRPSRIKRSGLASLMLTPLVDMFSLLVIFLLQVFSASPETLVATPGIQLPKAITGQELHDAPVLSLTKEELFLDRKRVGAIKEVLADPEELLTRLQALRRLWYSAHPKEKFPGTINLEAHEELSSNTVAHLMAHLASQQIWSIQLITLSGDPTSRGSR